MSEKEPILEPKEEIKETKEKEPEMRLKFFFSPHGRKEDFALLREEFDNCDVYIPEVPEQDPLVLTLLREISLGKLNPEKIIKGVKEKFHEEISELQKDFFEMLYNSKKLIYFVDVPKGHSSVFKKRESTMFDEQAFIEFASGRFEEALSDRKKGIEFFSKANEEREKYIKENIEKLKNQIFEEYPELKNQKEIEILISIGSAHTPLYHRFRKEEKIPAQWRFSTLPQAYNTYTELARQKQFFPNKELDNKKLARSLLEHIFLLVLEKNKNIKTTDELHGISRDLASKFSEESIENFSKKLSENPKIALEALRVPLIGGKLSWQELFEPPLKEWGVKLPETRKEVEEIIKKVEKKK